MIIGLVQPSGNQCCDRPCAVIGQVPVQLETISPMVAKKEKSIDIYKCIYIYSIIHACNGRIFDHSHMDFANLMQ